jgi:hypothetical protein
MCNYLNDNLNGCYDNLNGCSLYLGYIFVKNVQKIYSLFVQVNFQNCAAIKKNVTMVSKHSLIQISLYPLLTGQYMLPY